jgi:hypothetical protein
VRVRVGWTLLLLVTVPAVGSCAKTCEDYASAGLTVSVGDADGVPVCDAEVDAIDGTETIHLEPTAGSDCAYVGAWERAGHYVVSARRDGSAAMSERIAVSAGGCHVEGKRVELILSP